jgi:very-short-patch-repair endonuclease
MPPEFNSKMTECHRKLHSILSGMGFQVADNYRVGKYEIDCFVQELGIGFEADGTPYHTWKKRDKKRDQEILEEFKIPIFRVSDKSLLRKGVAEVEIQEYLKERFYKANEDIK